MSQDIASRFLPIAHPLVLESAYSEDQHQRLLNIVREHGPWKLILAQHFKSPEEVIATTSGTVPEGFTPTWDMFLSPVFRGMLAEDGVCLYPELEDCYYNSRFLDLARKYWGAQYAEPETMLFNIQGPSFSGGHPHVDGTRFRGLTIQSAPLWLLNTMCKSTLFTRWQAKKAQVIAWYYKGKVGGGFHYWPNGPLGEPETLPAPMWGRAVVVENERMYHSAEGNGPVAMRQPEGLAINSLMSPDSTTQDGWQITTDGRVVQRIPAQEFRFLVHWGAQVFMDYAELKTNLDHSDDLTVEKVLDIFIADLKTRGEIFEIPSDPLTDTRFIQLLTRVYDLGMPHNIPEDPVDKALVA